MTRFLVTYYASDMPSDPASIAEARRAFMQWAEKAGPALADVGAPVRSATTLAREAARDGVAGEPLMGWSVIEAANSEAAVRLVQDQSSYSPTARAGAATDAVPPRWRDSGRR